MAIKVTKSLAVGELANALNAHVVGDSKAIIDKIDTLQQAQSGALSFLSNKKYRKFLDETQATAVLVSSEFADLCATAAIVVADPYVAYAKATEILCPTPELEAGVHASAIISESASIAQSASIHERVIIRDDVVIGDNVEIGAGCYIEQGAVIGAGSRLFPNVTIMANCRIGKNATLHPGVVIGSDGFGFAKEGSSWLKVKQLAAVTIGDNVDIGANTTIDRGALSDTLIGNNVILDNQIQIGHNVTVGDGTAIAATAAVAGSTSIGSNCTIGGGVGMGGHLEIVDNVYITGFTMVTGSIKKPGLYSSGVAVAENTKWRKNQARFQQLDEMARRLKAVERKVNNNDNSK